MGRPRRTIHIDPLAGRRCSVWWDQKDVVYYELLKPGETVKRYQQQLINLNRSLIKKTIRIPKEATQGHFFP